MVRTSWGETARHAELRAMSLTSLEDAMAEAKVWLGEAAKFEPEDMESEMPFEEGMFSLQNIAQEYAARYTGDFEYMVDMRDKFSRWGELSPAQAKGVANCMLAGVRRRQPHQPAASRVTEAGMYRTPEGDIYKVQVAVHGSGNLYAKHLVLGELYEDEDGDHLPRKVTFEYESGALRKLTPEMRMTLEEAKAFGALYGTCCVCGRTLTNEVSIEAGIGPICSGRL